ncbi:MAG: hypothetical protein JWP45_3037 [Mucilaginibacter sp.]|nr:hypothetical protein [Mucilaginibacter sp.]
MKIPAINKNIRAILFILFGLVTVNAKAQTQAFSYTQ